MADEAEEPHEREEGVTVDVARAEGAVEVGPGKGPGRDREAEVDLAVLRADAHEGVEERKGAGDADTRN
jgi:hypothetical protein